MRLLRKTPGLEYFSGKTEVLLSAENTVVFQSLRISRRLSDQNTQKLILKIALILIHRDVVISTWRSTLIVVDL
jgi:hypothetical protein